MSFFDRLFKKVPAASTKEPVEGATHSPPPNSADFHVNRLPNGDIFVLLRKSFVDSSIQPEEIRNLGSRNAAIVALAAAFAGYQKSEMSSYAHDRALDKMVHEFKSAQEVANKCPPDWCVPCYYVYLPRL